MTKQLATIHSSPPPKNFPNLSAPTGPNQPCSSAASKTTGRCVPPRPLLTLPSTTHHSPLTTHQALIRRVQIRILPHLALHLLPLFLVIQQDKAVPQVPPLHLALRPFQQIG